MKSCTVIHILGTVENTLPPRYTCPFRVKAKTFFLGVPLTLLVFPQSLSEL